MSIYLEAEPDRPQIFDDAEESAPVDPAVAPLADGLRAAYVVRVAAYHRDLMRGAGAQDDDVDPPASAYPAVILPGGNPRNPAEDAEEIVCDAELFTTVFDLYALDGWAPVARLEAALAAKSKAKGQPHDPSAGTPQQRYQHAYLFFVYCRNMLAILIRESIMDMERRAAIQMIARLSLTADKVATAVETEFELTRTVTVLSHPGEADQKIPFYTYGNTELMKTLTAAVTEAVNQRATWQALVDSIGGFRGALNRTNSRIKTAKARAITPRTFDLAESERLAAIVAQKTDLRNATKDYYAAMKKIIGLNCPLALLAVDGLRPGFDQARLERVLGDAIWELYSRLDGLGAGIDPELSMVAKVLPGLPPSETGSIDMAAVQQLPLPRGGPEIAVVTAAIGGLRKNPAWFPVMHEMTWWLLLHRGEVTTDSFEYVVMHHYLDLLGERLDQMARSDEKLAEFFQLFAKISSALSVALLVTPLAELAPEMRSLSVMADLAVMAYQISSVTGQLAQLDEAIAEKLLEPTAFAMPSMGRIGELMFIRREYGGQLTEQLAMELLGIIAAGSWTLVRDLMIARGFLTDMETLMGTDTPDAE